MDDAGNERYLRYLLLLGEGGQLVLQGILFREVAKSKQSLETNLLNNRDILSRTIKNPQELNRVFPTTSSVNGDVTTWDITLLGLVIIQVFGKQLSPVEMDEVKKIYEKRIRMYGKLSSASLTENDYKEKRLELSMRLLRLAAHTDFSTHYECLDIVSTYGAKPLGLLSMIRQLVELREFEKETVENICVNLEIEMEELDANVGDTEFSNRQPGIQRHSFTRHSQEGQNDLREESWYFGTLSREETNEIFEHVTTDGIFLVRDCNSTPGDFVLCVKEGDKVCQFVINRLHADGNVLYRIGEKDFDDMQPLLEFYRTHYLDKSPLVDPVPRKKFLTTSDFDENDSKDLSFKKGEVLELIAKEDDKWWHAKNEVGRIGLVPKLFLSDLKDEEGAPEKGISRKVSPIPPVPVRLPSKAVVSRTRIPSPYDKTRQLTLYEGDIVLVTRIMGDGHFFGECKGKTGLFPSKNVTFLDNF